MTTKACMPEVVELVEQLRPTGTGPHKLERLLELGSETTTLEAFMERATKEMPTLTMQKIKDLWGVAKPTPPVVETKPIVPAVPAKPVVPVVETKVTDNKVTKK